MRPAKTRTSLRICASAQSRKSLHSTHVLNREVGLASHQKLDYLISLNARTHAMIFPEIAFNFSFMRGYRKFRQKGSKFNNVIILVDEGMEDPNITINGLSSARQRNAI